jgi:hypothetical protein
MRTVLGNVGDEKRAFAHRKIDRPRDIRDCSDTVVRQQGALAAEYRDDSPFQFESHWGALETADFICSKGKKGARLCLKRYWAVFPYQVDKEIRAVHLTVPSRSGRHGNSDVGFGVQADVDAKRSSWGLLLLLLAWRLKSELQSEKPFEGKGGRIVVQ